MEDDLAKEIEETVDHYFATVTDEQFFADLEAAGWKEYAEFGDPPVFTESSEGRSMTETATVERSGTWQLRRWCPVGKMHQDAEDRQCDGCDPIHYLRLRRMMICSVCEMGFFTDTGFDKHECWDAY